jgi:phage gp36-like protein
MPIPDDFAAFALPDDLISRYDRRLIADLATDEGETLPAEDLGDHPAVLTALQDASGEMLVALAQGGRYTVDQLEGLSGYALHHRKRICCDIAMNLLMKRRPIVDEERAAAIAKQSREHLKSLAAGENVFGLEEHIDAGMLELSTVSTVEIENLNLLPTRMGRYFPDTAQRTPRN